MRYKLRLVALPAMALGISLFTLGFSRTNNNLFVQAGTATEIKSGEEESQKPQTGPHEGVTGKYTHEISTCKSQEAAPCKGQDCKSEKYLHHNKCCPDYHHHHDVCPQEKKGKGHAGGHTASEMLGLVHCAKKELLKEKIKGKLEARMGAKLDKVADLLVEAMFEEYEAVREGKERHLELEKRLQEIFSQKDGEEQKTKPEGE